MPTTVPSTRDRILEVAARLFQEQGFAATGVSTILREADVNSGSLYHFFPSKDALLVGVLERYLDMLHPIVLSPREEAATDPIERVFLLLAWYREGLEVMGCGMGCPIGNLALEVSDTHPEIRPLIHQNFQNWKAGIERWLVEAGNRLPHSVDRTGLASLVLTVMEGGIMQSRAERTLTPFDASVKQLRLYIDLLLAQGSGASVHSSATARTKSSKTMATALARSKPHAATARHSRPRAASSVHSKPGASSPAHSKPHAGPRTHSSASRKNTMRRAATPRSTRSAKKQDPKKPHRSVRRNS